MTLARPPAAIQGTPDLGTTRWLWLIKWLLVLPHWLILAVLYIGMVFATFFAFIAIVFTGRYPRALFNYNLGVLRWSWRVGFYAYGMLGTDRYPPFTMQAVADYPASLDIAYPQRLSRGLVWVKWLFAIPHLLIVGILVGSSLIGGFGFTSGLAGLLVIIAAVIRGFSGQRQTQLDELVMGFHRWALRVTAYGLLMTDDYPPFQLDQGFDEPHDR